MQIRHGSFNSILPTSPINPKGFAYSRGYPFASAKSAFVRNPACLSQAPETLDSLLDKQACCIIPKRKIRGRIAAPLTTPRYQVTRSISSKAILRVSWNKSRGERRAQGNRYVVCVPGPSPFLAQISSHVNSCSLCSIYIIIITIVIIIDHCINCHSRKKKIGEIH